MILLYDETIRTFQLAGYYTLTHSKLPYAQRPIAKQLAIDTRYDSAYVRLLAELFLFARAVYASEYNVYLNVNVLAGICHNRPKFVLLLR